MPTEYHELVSAIALIEEMVEYLNHAGGAEIHTGSIFHQQMMGTVDDYYAKRKNHMADVEV